MELRLQLISEYHIAIATRIIKDQIEYFISNRSSII